MNNENANDVLADTPVTPATVPAEIIDPISGEAVDANDIDGLVDMLERLREDESRLRAAKFLIAGALAGKVAGDNKTERLRGERRRVKVEQPDDAYDQSRLKEAYFSYPQYAQEFMTIATVKLRFREWNKALRETGPEAFQQFVSMVKSANRGPQGAAKITIEE